jgi:hypothetical protein
MPRVREIGDMISKYTIKYDGANVTAVLTAIKALMESRYEAASSPIFNAVETARRILSDKGVPPAQWGVYLAFAEQVASYQFSHSGLTLQKVLSGIKSYFVTAHGADPTILDSIIAELTGVTPAY